METKLHLIGVRAGDATLIQHVDGGQTFCILVDGGWPKSTILEYLHEKGISHLDLVVASHLDYDHLAGLLAVFNDLSIGIGEFWTYDITILKRFLETGEIPEERLLEPEYVLRFLTADDLLRRCQVRGIPCKQVVAGDVARFGGLVFEVLYPSQTYLQYLYSPRTLKKMLEHRKVPLDWKIGSHEHSPEVVAEDGKRKPHRRLKFPKDDSPVRKWKRKARPLYEKWTKSDSSALEAMSTYRLPDEQSPLHDGGIGTDSEAARSEFSQEEGEGEPLGPWEICSDSTIMNDLSTVFRVSSIGREGVRSILFTGDLENWTPLILSNGFQLRSDVLKVPHHGSDGVRWNPDAAFQYSESRMRGWYARGLFDLRAECYFPICLCPRVFHPAEFRGDFGDILDFVRPEQALLFPYPNRRLPRQSTLDHLRSRRICAGEWAGWHKGSVRKQRNAPDKSDYR